MAKKQLLNEADKRDVVAAAEATKQMCSSTFSAPTICDQILKGKKLPPKNKKLPVSPSCIDIAQYPFFTTLL